MKYGDKKQGIKPGLKRSGLSGLLTLLGVAWGVVFLVGIRCYIVMSGSMEPAIPTGSVCFVNTCVKYEDIQEGDVIAFFHGGGMVTHRVLSVTDEGLETKGDANGRSDGITTGPENFHGKTIFHIPYVGYGLMLCKKPWVQGIFAVWIALLLLSGARERRGRNGETN